MSFDAGILALPFYEPRHVECAREIESWCAEHTELWDDPNAATDPDATGLRILRALGEHGWLAALDPAAGPENSAIGDCRSVCLMREALAYADDLADFAFSIQALAATPIARHGDEQQRRQYLAPMAKGILCGAFAISEPMAGSDVAAIGLRAERLDDGYVLNGAKAWIANGGIADVFCVIARTGEGPGALGLTAFLVPATTPGLTVGPRVGLIAPRSFADLEFEDCRLPLDSVLGRPGGGFVIAMEVLERFRTTVGAAALGFARRAADAALTHAKNRPMYGARQFDLQLVKAGFADAEVELNAAALLVARAAWEIDRGNPTAAKHSSIAKLYATERAQGIVDACVQIFGAAGLVSDSVPERLYRQIRSLRIYEGASEVLKMIIAGSLGSGRGRTK
ncbi:acyl-CoA dehydrogenase family protein [Nocardia pseudobrasiliensis]|uniref:Acyl-CoA dehydrogenase n=1 Tax=Nocardia pseudobrasiliensis TaxID=45979 RepID=A0A370ID41_9NOCA|nr:acyl-CoA dehydrogenase family protein [Nocardia pseudobrasiliensis]RDI68639.1 acyl-CoA dehydrogenase [Nocardia pseudobrasiliensis]